MSAEYSLRIIMAPRWRNAPSPHKESTSGEWRRTRPFSFFISNYSVRCFADEIPAMLEIFLRGGVFAGCAPVQPTRCERDHISKVHQLIMNTFTQPCADCIFFSSRWRPFLCTSASALKQLFDYADNELRVIGHMIGLVYEAVLLLLLWTSRSECGEQQCKVLCFPKSGLAWFWAHRSSEAVWFCRFCTSPCADTDICTGAALAAAHISSALISWVL